MDLEVIVVPPMDMVFRLPILRTLQFQMPATIHLITAVQLRRLSQIMVLSQTWNQSVHGLFQGPMASSVHHLYLVLNP